MPHLIRLTLLLTLFLSGSILASPFVMPAGLSEAEKNRFKRFETFHIKGVCNEDDLERLAKLGVNAVRGYTLGEPKEMKEKLDYAHRLGIKMIVSEWMPHHGENKNNDGHKWDFDYNAKGEEMVANLMRRIEAIGDHPAILMWGLGNEVHLEEPYLRTVNRMSQEIHKRFPHHLTSLTMVNAKPEHIQKIKQFAPDLDVLGIQCYSRGAVRGGIKSAEANWGKPFYMSEFNTNGPWNFGKTPWGTELDEPVTKKVSDLKDCYVAIDESSLCVGSTIFVWGYYPSGDRPTYFTLLLDPDPNGTKNLDFRNLMMTPQAEVMAENFLGKPLEGNHAPVISKLEFEGGANSRLAKPGEAMSVQFAAPDANGDKVEFLSWIMATKVKKSKSVAGPFPQTSPDHTVINAPTKPGDYLVMVYAKDNKGGASATVLPFKVTADGTYTPAPSTAPAKP